MSDHIAGLDHHRFMKEALKEAEAAGKRGDLPIGAVIVHEGRIIARGSNMRKTMESKISHAETNAMNDCAPYLMKHAPECVIYTTVEPCIMCLTTLVMANIRSIVFAAEDKYMNMKPFIESNPYIRDRVHHYIEGVCREESEALLRQYSPYAAELALDGTHPHHRKGGA
ncbi:nucleoside deaminase [Alteribacter natronophilus]|uniref:nucleoside deaminase n=1 Tax=Alteribacter natronophilus TaxID=2583810 RepID=UPI00110E4CFF|nr:nucleoside deaminase [Alteribacter natronophilus]TMW71080.1 nucleoside deaminase [Alteribacter natronophilus]